MFETSKDLLYVVISFAVLWLTIFFSWMLYYVIMILKQSNDMVKGVREKIEKVGETIEKIKEKFDHASNYVGFLAKAVEKLVEFTKEKKRKKKKEEEEGE